MVTFLFPELKRRSKSFGDLKKGQVYDHQPYRHSMFFPSALTTRPTHAPLQQSFKRFVSEPAFPTLHVSIDPCQDQLYPLALTSPPDSTTSNNTDAASSTVQKVSPTNLLTNDSTVNDVIANAPFSPLPPADNNVQIFDVLDNPSPAFIHYSQRSAKPNTTIISVTVEKLVEIMTKDMETELMTGFFLTFRDYLTPIRLCKLLILRFRWALKDDSDARRLVRIRTFVVLRYWISHYWEHDFKDARPLRFMLCTFLSKVRSHPLIQTSPRDDRIVHQLRHLLKLQKKKYHSPSHGSLDSASITLDSDNPLQPKKRERQVSATSSASIPFSVLTNTTSSPRHSMQESWHLGLQSIKRTLPSVCHSLVQNLSPPTKPADRDSALFHHDQCSCSATPRHQRRISNKWALPERWFSSLSASPSIPSADEPCPLHPKSSANLPAQPLRRPLDRRPRPLSHPHHAQPPHQRQQHRASYYSEGAVSDGSVRSKGTITSLPAMLTLDLAADPPTKSSYQSLVLIYRSETIAQQFTLLEQQMLQHVTWNELVDLRWRKRSKGTVLSPDLPLQHGVEQLIGFFNKTCQWVSSEIVRTQSIGKRARVIAKFIRIAMKCHQHKNYSTLMQILLGLQSPWVTRLERTWQRVGQFEMQAFGELKELAKPFRNWKNVREAMTLVTQDIDEASALEAVLSQQHHTTTLPGCIPFLGLYLSDLVFNAELPTWIDAKIDTVANDQLRETKHQSVQDQLLYQSLVGRMVNYNKFRITACTVKHILTFQVLSRNYSFTSHSVIALALDNLDYLDDDSLQKESYHCEP